MNAKKAGSKWCPMTRLVFDRDYLATNHSTGFHGCEGSECAWWRWKYPDQRNEDGYCGIVGPEN